MNLSDAVYATSTMDLRLRYFSQSARVPLHPIQYSLRPMILESVTSRQGDGVFRSTFLQCFYAEGSKFFPQNILTSLFFSLTV